MVWKKLTVLMGMIALCLASTGLAGQAGPQTMTFDGRAFGNSEASVPMLDIISTKIQILTPAQDCVLYEETQTIDTRSSNGYFTIQIGSALSDPKRTGYDSNLAMSKVFANSTTAVTGKRVTDGTACTYNSSTGDKRYVRVQMTPSADGVTRNISPNMLLDSVPNAMVAETIQGLAPTDFVQINNAGSAVLSQSNVENIFSSSNYPNLVNLLSVAPTSYVRTGTNGSASLPSVAGNPATGLTAGQIWYDSTANVIKYYDGATKTLGTSTGLSSVGLTMPAMFTVTGSPLTANGSITAALANQNANLVFAGPASGGAAAPTFRALAAADLPITGAGGAYVNGGNSFGAAATLGTNDSNTFAIKTNNTARMSFDTSGNVTMGTGVLNISTATSGNVEVLRLANSNGGGNASGMGFYVNSTKQSEIYAYDNNLTFNLATGAGTMLWRSNNSTKMTMDSAGNLGIGTTSPISLLDVNGVISLKGVNGIRYPASDSQGAGYSIAIGPSAATSLDSLTSGAYNTIAIGANALGATGLNSSSNNNIAIGSNALAANTSGFVNTAVGTGSLSLNTTGNSNTGFGFWSLRKSTGSNNSGLGRSAGISIISGDDNTFVGSAAGAGISNYTASRQTFVGSGAGDQVSGGADNTALGYRAGHDLSTGSFNIILGSYATAGVGITSGSNNILIGQDVRPSSQTGNNQMNIGNLIYATGLGSGATASSGNVGIGTASPSSALDVVTTVAGGGVNVRNTGAGSYTRLSLLNDQNSLSRSLELDYVGSTLNFIPYYNSRKGEQGAMGTIGNYPLSLISNNTMRMTLDGNGNVGVGTSLPHNSFSVSPIVYPSTLGQQASQSGNTVTGNGTSFTAAMLGAELVYANGVSGGTITAVNSSTSLTVSTSQTVAANFFTANRYGFEVTSSGLVGISTINPQAALDVATTGSNSAIIVPRDTTANRPSTPVEGMFRYNTTNKSFEGYQETAWQRIQTANIICATGAQTGNGGTAGACVRLSDGHLCFRSSGASTWNCLTPTNWAGDGNWQCGVTYGTAYRVTCTRVTDGNTCAIAEGGTAWGCSTPTGWDM